MLMGYVITHTPNTRSFIDLFWHTLKKKRKNTYFLPLYGVLSLVKRIWLELSLVDEMFDMMVMVDSSSMIHHGNGMRMVWFIESVLLSYLARKVGLLSWCLFASSTFKWFPPAEGLSDRFSNGKQHRNQ